MDKKAQLTIFILVAFVLVLIAGLLIYINRQGEIMMRDQLQPIQETPAEILSIKNYVDKCIEDTLMPGIYLLGFQGGYIYNEQPVFLTDKDIIRYHYHNEQNTSPSLIEMQNQLSQFMEQALPICIDDFQIFKQIGKDITNGSIKAQTIIAENIEININYPITLRENGKTTSEETFIHTVPINLKHIYDINQRIVDKVQEDPKHIDLTFLSQFDTRVTVLPHSDNTIVYALYDNTAVEYVFMFATQNILNSAPRLDFIPDFVLAVGQRLIYDVNATDLDNDDLLFFTSPIHIYPDTGIIDFTPTYADEFDIEIIVEDTVGNQDTQIVHFRIQ